MTPDLHDRLRRDFEKLGEDMVRYDACRETVIKQSRGEQSSANPLAACVIMRAHHVRKRLGRLLMAV